MLQQGVWQSCTRPVLLNRRRAECTAPCHDECLPELICSSRLRGEFTERRREAVEAVYEAKPMPQVCGAG